MFLLKQSHDAYSLLEDRKVTLNRDHSHLSNIDCLRARTAYLVCYISTVNGRSKKTGAYPIGASCSA
jgi:hypothetical protein